MPQLTDYIENSDPVSRVECSYLPNRIIRRRYDVDEFEIMDQFDRREGQSGHVTYLLLMSGTTSDVLGRLASTSTRWVVAIEIYGPDGGQ